MARSPLTDDTKPESFAEGVAKRQAIVRGSFYAGKGLKTLGSSMVAYGSTTRPSGRSSHVMRRGSSGERQNWKFTHQGVTHDRPAPSRSNRWLGYETKHDSKAGTKAPSSRTSQKSASLVNLGTVVYAAGKAVPYIGIGYGLYSAFGISTNETRSPAEHFTDDLREQDSRLRSSPTIISDSWNSLGPTQQFMAKTVVWALFS